MFPNHRFRKSLILIGGSGEFGKLITARFAKPFMKRWNVFNIDSVANPDATGNFVIENLHEFDEDSDIQGDHRVFNETMLKKLHAKLKEVAPEYDAIVNVAGSPRDKPLVSSLADGFELFEEYERVKRYELYSSLLTANLATHHLSPDGYILFKS